MATVIAAKPSMAPRIMALDHATIPSIDVMADLEFYEKYLGANLMPRTPGEPRSFDHPAPFVNLKTERILYRVRRHLGLRAFSAARIPPRARASVAGASLRSGGRGRQPQVRR